MQYSYIHKLFNHSGILRAKLLFKAFILIISLVFVLYALNQHTRWNTANLTNIITQDSSLWLLVLVIILMPINWTIETLKWKFLVDKTTKVTFLNALKGILSGVAISFVTPAGTGDYVGRVLQMHVKNRLKYIGMIFLTNFSQLYITVLMGCISCLFILPDLKISTSNNHFYLFSIALLLLLTIVTFFNLSIFNWFKYQSITRQLYLCFHILKKVTLMDKLKVTSLSLVRYVVFSIQFIILLIYFGVNCDLSILAGGVSFIFLSKTIIPTFLDLGVREAAAVFYFSDVSSPQVVLTASLCLWIINVVTPVIAGVFMLPGFKWKTS